MNARLDDFAQAHINRFDGVGGVNHFADFRRIVEERRDAGPMAPPGLADRLVVLVPFDLELREHALGLIDSGSAVDDAQLNGRLGKTASMASGNPFSPSTQAMSCTPRFFNSVTTCSQNLAPSVWAIHRPSTSLWPSMFTPMAR